MLDVPRAVDQLPVAGAAVHDLLLSRIRAAAAYQAAATALERSAHTLEDRPLQPV